MQSEIDTGLEGRGQWKEGRGQSPGLLQVSCMFLEEGAYHMSQGLDIVPLSAPSHEGSEQAKDSGSRVSSWGHQPLHGFCGTTEEPVCATLPKEGAMMTQGPWPSPASVFSSQCSPQIKRSCPYPPKVTIPHYRTSWRIWKRLTQSPFIFEAQPKLFVGPPLSVSLPCVSSLGGLTDS